VSPEAHDVQIDIRSCACGHSDCNTAVNGVEQPQYLRPGHEICLPRDGRVVLRSNFKVGELAGVGLAWSISYQSAVSCLKGFEQYGRTALPAPITGRHFGGENTLGGYLDHICG